MKYEEKYYGCNEPEAISYLEFGSINLIKGQKTIWNYWQDQKAYDLYMFARYSNDLFAFRHFFQEEQKTPQKLNEYVLKAAHNKLLDYLFKYAGMLAIPGGGVICESGSSLYGWIDEAIACDYVYHAGENIEKINNFEYLCSDISELMNEGAAAFHSAIKMSFSTADTIEKLVDDVQQRLQKNIDLFYGVSVSIRYAIRSALDLVKMAENSQLMIFNRLSLTYDHETRTAIYGTGKYVYIISLEELVEGLERKGIKAKYCTSNMQFEKDGKNTVRASIAIAKDGLILDRFISAYNYCVEQSLGIQGVQFGEWKDLKELRNQSE